VPAGRGFRRNGLAWNGRSVSVSVDTGGGGRHEDRRDISRGWVAPLHLLVADRLLDLGDRFVPVVPVAPRHSPW